MIIKILKLDPLVCKLDCNSQRLEIYDKKQTQIFYLFYFHHLQHSLSFVHF